MSAESELSGYWSARRALDNLDRTYEWDDASTDLIWLAVDRLDIGDVVALAVDFDDEDALLREILIGNGIEPTDDTLNPPVISFDMGFTCAVVEYDVATFGTTG